MSHDFLDDEKSKVRFHTKVTNPYIQRSQKRKRGLDSTLLGFQPTDIVEYEVSSESYKLDYYASYGRFKSNNIVLNAPSYHANPNWSSTHAGDNLRQELDAYGKSGESFNNTHGKSQAQFNSSVVHNVVTNNQEALGQPFGETPEKPVKNTLVAKPPKSIRKPPKAPRLGKKGENLIRKFNDPEHGCVNAQIGIIDNSSSNTTEVMVTEKRVKPSVGLKSKQASIQKYQVNRPSLKQKRYVNNFSAQFICRRQMSIIANLIQI